MCVCVCVVSIAFDVVAAVVIRFVISIASVVVVTVACVE